MTFDRFTPEGIALFRSRSLSGGEPGGGPVRARFVSAHLLFTLGSFVAEVPYDPDLYFIGEEISLAIRAFTHGYDLFHPGVHVAWHEYSRSLRPKHWDDHLPGSGTELPWHTRDAASLDKVRRFLAGPDIGPFGCGSVRSFDDYQLYSGVDFRRRLASRAARAGEEPPPPPAPGTGAGPRRTWIVRVEIDQRRLAAAALDSPLFWYVGFHDADGVEIARDDLTPAEVRRRAAGGSGSMLVERCFASRRTPASWTIWPTDRRGRWLERLEGPIPVAEGPAPVISVRC
jgi:hypothetical protein